MTKAPIAIFADLHLHEHAAFATERDGFNSRLVDSRDVALSIVSKSFKIGVRDVIHAGDWFHARRKVSVACLDVSEHILRKCDTIGVRVHTIPGNHDLSLDGRACSIVGQPFASVILNHGDVREISGWRVCFIPWTDDPDVVSKCLSVDADLYVGHFGVDGSRVGPSDFEMPGHINAKVLANRANKRAPVLLGHYHKPQDILDESTKYVGSPLQQCWGEAGEEKRFLVLHANGALKSYALRDGPRFLRLRENELRKARPCDFVELMVDSIKQVRRARHLVDDVRGSAPTSIVLRDTPKGELPALDLTGISVSDQLSKYVDHVGVPDGIDREWLMNLGLSLLGEST